MLLLLATPAVTWAAGLDWYVRRDHWQDTLQASLAARRQGGAARDLKLSDWSWVGPFAIPDNRELGKVFATRFAPLWDQLIRDFPAAAQQIAWVRDDNLYGDQPPSRFYRYDDPQVTRRSGGKTHVDESLRDSLPVSERPAHVGRWQYTIAGAPGGVIRQGTKRR